MRYLAFLTIILMVSAIVWGGYNLIKENRQLKIQVDELNSHFNKLKEENSSLQSQIEYFQNPQNLLKQLKQQFNYKEAGEKLIILIPSSTAP